jgi:hypothetical protein
MRIANNLCRSPHQFRVAPNILPEGSVIERLFPSRDMVIRSVAPLLHVSNTMSPEHLHVLVRPQAALCPVPPGLNTDSLLARDGSTSSAQRYSCTSFVTFPRPCGEAADAQFVHAALHPRTPTCPSYQSFRLLKQLERVPSDRWRAAQ